MRRETEIAVNAPPADSLIGKGSNDLTALLGPPGLVRRERGVEVWQYAEGECVLLFYLYENAAGGERKVTYLEAVPKGGGEVTKQTCLAEQMRERIRRTG